MNKTLGIIAGLFFALFMYVSFGPHPFRSLCLYKYETVIKDMKPARTIYSYNIVRMPTVCVNAAADERFVSTSRITLAEGPDTPENRKLFEVQLQNLVAKEVKK